MSIKSCIAITLSTVVLIVGIDKEMYGFHKKYTWINSSVIVSAKKLAIHLLVHLYQSYKIYSRCLIRILKVKYTELRSIFVTTAVLLCQHVTVNKRM